MNTFDLLKKIQDFRSLLETWGVSSALLWAVGAIAVFFFVLSTREVLGWYLRTNQLRDEVYALRKEIAELRAVLEGQPAPAQDKKGAETASKSGLKAFRLDHWRNSL
jgi:hypothetical protein